MGTGGSPVVLCNANNHDLTFKTLGWPNQGQESRNGVYIAIWYFSDYAWLCGPWVCRFGFNSMSISHPIPEMWLFQNLTSKIQGQGHGWGEYWKSKSGCNILSIHIAFIPCQSALPFLRYSILKLENPRSRSWVWGGHWKSQSGCSIPWTHITFVPCRTAVPFLRYDFFKIWPWKSKVKVMGEVDIKSHSMGPTFYRFTSL